MKWFEFWGHSCICCHNRKCAKIEKNQSSDNLMCIVDCLIVVERGNIEHVNIKGWRGRVLNIIVKGVNTKFNVQ